MRFSRLSPVVLLAVSLLPGAGFACESNSELYIFGIDVEDLRRAAVERRNSAEWKAADDPAVVEFTIEPEPKVLMAYTPDGIFEYEWFMFNPGPTPTMELPAGTYELLVSWSYPNVAEISILEGVELPTGTHQIDVQQSDVEHILSLIPIGPGGSVLPEGVTTAVRALRRAGCDLPVLRSSGRSRPSVTTTHSRPTPSVGMTLIR